MNLNEIENVISRGPFSADWDSLSNFTPPKWMRERKFGIFIHWGPFSVPAYHDWYARNMYIKDSPEFEHHVKTYGAHKDFGYKDFIPMLTAEKFDPSEWAELIKNTGAGYVVPVAEHHDGFQMYKSDISKWNAFEMGPKRDTLGELLTACDKKGIIRGASSHRLEHWFFFSHGKNFESDVTDDPNSLYYPAKPEPEHHDLNGEPAPSREYLEDWLLRCCEIVENYRPQLFYFDWWVQHQAVKPYLKKFTAYYYNRAREWGFEPAITYKHDAYMFGAAVVDIERGKFSDIQPFFWQTDTAVAKNSWCYSNNAQYKKTKTILADLVDIVSKNGSLLLNIGPKPDGTIPDGDRKILEEIGAWMKVNGEAVYGTKVWRKPAEGPTQTKEGQFTDGTEQEFTCQDIRFTVKGSYIYAFVLKSPDDGRVRICSLGKKYAWHLPVFSGIIKNAEMLGGKILNWERDTDGLNIHFEPTATELPIVFKILID